jgi:hypothetical protein
VSAYLSMLGIRSRTGERRRSSALPYRACQSGSRPLFPRGCVFEPAQLHRCWSDNLLVAPLCRFRRPGRAGNPGKRRRRGSEQLRVATTKIWLRGAIRCYSDPDWPRPRSPVQKGAPGFFPLLVRRPTVPRSHWECRSEQTSGRRSRGPQSDVSVVYRRPSVCR